MTRADLTDQLEINSPTGCYFSAPTPRGGFMHDCQGCVEWSLDEKGRVLANYEEVVANNLPGFLSRVRIENDIWNKTYPFWFLGRDNFDRLDWTQLSPEETEYVRHYLDGWKKKGTRHEVECL